MSRAAIPAPIRSTANSSGKPAVIITGGTGFIGKRLTAFLADNGYEVILLSRKVTNQRNARICKWEPEKGIIDADTFESVGYIIHLAGANIGEKRWTVKRKKEIIESRSMSARLIFETLKKSGKSIKEFISASATVIYGTVTTEHIFTEEDAPATDYLGNVCRQWEEAADLFSLSGIRTVKIRTAVVLDTSEGALAKLMMPAKFGFLVKTGTGDQYFPWIHPEDLCRIYLKAIEDPEMQGSYNAVAPGHVTQYGFMKILGKLMKKGVFPIGIPRILLRVALGEMSGVVMEGSRVSSEKLIKAGFSFRFNSPEEALKNLLPD